LVWAAGGLPQCNGNLGRSFFSDRPLSSFSNAGFSERRRDPPKRSVNAKTIDLFMRSNGVKFISLLDIAGLVPTPFIFEGL
jgi:hypothetical protein